MMAEQTSLIVTGNFSHRVFGAEVPKGWGFRPAIASSEGLSGVGRALGGKVLKTVAEH